MKPSRHPVSVLHQPTTTESRTTASIQVACPRCEEMSFTRLDGPHETTEGLAWSCPHCHASPRDPGPRPVPSEPVAKCWVCGADEFYIQKDFNRQLGLFIVLLSAGVIFLFMLITQDHRLGIGLLLGVAFLDWLVYRLIKNVTVCYLCQSLYRGLPQSPSHTGFYLGNEEKYKPLRKRWLEERV